ncbi:DNA-binding XRE family transcriptional regulator [Tenacibaculum lutimaris]|uniref:DNA-binding XRE family transcriptional regulator n=1 Tax=Tenacibaculum lutimaris TaxID=285258 RepID=A0A420DZH6_9FLAO|nr:helix-turn-helix transcriptional regulator [Tenacibaculum lutimaris]RKF03254.1 DNA-binding XRE family transcriptional regulator [Tenacibaculum lutimaris]
MERVSIILEKIKKEREKEGLSQYEFGKKIGLSQNAYFKLETGKTRLDMYRFLTICKVLNISPEEFL